MSGATITLGSEHMERCVAVIEVLGRTGKVVESLDREVRLLRKQVRSLTLRLGDASE